MRIEATIRLAERTLLAIDEEIAGGEVLTLMGPSGSGKSSLVAWMGGFLPPVFTARGRILCGPDDLALRPAPERRLGLLFQDPLLFPHMSVGGNLLFALPPGRRDGRRERAEAVLQQAGLGGFFDRDPATLSGGQAARVALLRTLLSEPRALLLDEPFSKLDAALRGQVRSFVFAEAARENLPVLLVTHDEADAEAAGGRIVRL